MSRVLDKYIPFIKLAKNIFGSNIISRKQICDMYKSPSRVSSRKGYRIGDALWPNWLLNDPQYRVGRGLYKLPSLPTPLPGYGTINNFYVNVKVYEK